MVNHPSAIKRLRQNKKSRLRNRYDHKSARTALRKFRKNLNLSQSQQDINKETLKTNQEILYSLLDKLAKKNIIHNNKASRLKSQVARAIASA